MLMGAARRCGQWDPQLIPLRWPQVRPFFEESGVGASVPPKAGRQVAKKVQPTRLGARRARGNSAAPLEGLPGLPDGLDVLFGLQAQRRDAAVARVRLFQRELVPECRRTRVRRRWPELLQAWTQGRGVQEGRWRRVAGRETLPWWPETWQALQRRGASARQRWPEPRLQRQGTPRRSATAARAGP